MNVVNIDSSTFDTFKRRVLKFLRLGLRDVQTAKEAGPYGVDSSPIKGMVALYAPSGVKGKNYIVGYLNINQLAQPGEFRAYSTDGNGALKTYLWLKADGSMEVGGSSDNLVRYSPLDQSLQNLATALNQELAAISAGILAAGGTYTPGTITIDIASAQTPNIKTA